MEKTYSCWGKSSLIDIPSLPGFHGQGVSHFFENSEHRSTGDNSETAAEGWLLTFLQRVAASHPNPYRSKYHLIS